jgi:hypothetical protein
MHRVDPLTSRPRRFLGTLTFPSAASGFRLALVFAQKTSKLGLLFSSKLSLYTPIQQLQAADGIGTPLEQQGPN